MNGFVRYNFCCHIQSSQNSMQQLGLISITTRWYHEKCTMKIYYWSRAFDFDLISNMIVHYTYYTFLLNKMKYVDFHCLQDAIEFGDIVNMCHTCIDIQDVLIQKRAWQSPRKSAYIIWPILFIAMNLFLVHVHSHIRSTHYSTRFNEVQTTIGKMEMFCVTIAF